MKKIILTLLLLTITFVSRANIIINSTRVIYPQGSKEVPVQLFNTGTQQALVQAWIDDGNADSTPETANVPFILTPPVVKIDGKNGQQLRVKMTPAQLPADRESLFYLNLLDIPPLPENSADKNMMQIAIRSRIKLFYRPSGLTLNADKAHTRLTFTRDGQHYILKNDSPYHINILGLKETANNRDLAEEGTMIAPYSQFTLPAASGLPAGNHYSLTLIDDFGAINSYPLSLN
ncbi:pilus assembly protein [Morganella morganii]|uniref:Pilus assembly protein n=1 Tax=Morganella morganii TaxID=582 RepID=A0A433ZY87_MORMO|nr:molecular chaperone [Morganella morganii]RUT67079.1 pilus assembly protein [Morganella morganii]